MCMLTKLKQINVSDYWVLQRCLFPPVPSVWRCVSPEWGVCCSLSLFCLAAKPNHRPGDCVVKLNQQLLWQVEFPEQEVHLLLGLHGDRGGFSSPPQVLGDSPET